MKKPLAILTTTIAAALGLLFLAACANPFINPRARDNPAGEGRGLVRIETGAGPARTVLPGAVFDHYEYAFSHEGAPAGAIEPIAPGGDKFELETGNWTVAVEAYAGPENDTLAATGSGSFTVNLGEETEVTVRLSPIVSSGTGTLNYALAYPDGAVVSSFTLTLLAGEEDIDLLEDAVSGSGSLAGTITAPSGYYLARAFMQKNGVAAGKNEVVHIYNNLATNLELKFVEDNFKAIVVVSSADSGPGTLREALTGVRAADSVAGATIRIDLPEGDRVITLRSVLPQINKSLVIEGNGTTLTQLNVAETVTSQLLYVNNSTAEVRISRLHFKGGRTSGYGAAIRNIGKLTLESCVFSDNRNSSNSGGAIHTSNAASSLTISGCTFYENAGGYGGAIYIASGVATLTGNVFWGNTATQRSVVYGAPVSGGFNISDKASGLDYTSGSGWDFTNGDDQALSRPVSYISFRPLEGGEAIGVITERPADYPALDFYGVAIPQYNAAAGAAQTAATGTGFYLDYASIGSGRVSVTAGSVDFDGFVNGSSVILTASEDDGVFRGWIVDGMKHDEPSNVLTLNINSDTTVRAVFYIAATSTADSGPGTLREALTDVSDGGGILLPEGQTITLNTPLPNITKSLTIEGNGATLTQRGFTAGTTSQLLTIYSSSTPKVRISRLHFKGGRANGNGAALRNVGGALTLESCIFSDNQTNSYGGAIFSQNLSNTASITISGCTFYGNMVEGSSAFNIHRGPVAYVANGNATLTGNVFWGNTAPQDNVIYVAGSFASGGFNVSDKEDGTDTTSGSGWTFTNGDKQALSLPVSTVSFRPIGGGAVIGVITERPADYPAKDFYGVDIPLYNAAAGAAQTPATGSGHFLDYAPLGPGTVNVVAGSVDSDGFAGASVTLMASENVNGAFRYWTVDDGTERRELSNPLSLDVSGNTVVRAMFYTKVTSTANSGPETLRDVLALTSAGEGIVLPAGETITLTSDVLNITKSIVIEGNGATLTQSGITNGSTALLSINGSMEVRIVRLHFKGTNGGAISVTLGGRLTLESCIFSNNRKNNSGSAVSISTSGATVASAIISGCTFYKNTNTSSSSGGVISAYNSPVTLTGNVFWGNTATTNNVIAGGPITSGGFNVSDKASGTDPTLGSGWDFAGDKQAPLSISPISFKPISGGEAIGFVTTPPPGYPAVDFYGVAIPPSNAAAGAVQTPTAGTGFYLDYGSTGPGSVNVADAIVDSDGLITSGTEVILTAQAGANGAFMYWTVDGVEAEEQSKQLVVTMDDHRTVRAVFYLAVTSAADDGGPGTLRSVLAAASAGDGILLPANRTITLSNPPLPQINKNLVIEGNGATLTQNGFEESATSQLLAIGGEVRISRLHFKGGRATDAGAAIRKSTGKLTLESCIFSDNQVTGVLARGGAIFLSGTQSTISGCTFYANSGGSGGAVCLAGPATFIGNIFWGNTAAQSNVIYNQGYAFVSGGYNVSDKEDGSDSSAGSGWAFAGNDIQLSGVSFDANLRPSHSDLPAIPSPPVGNPDLFPLRYFDGTLRGSTPGAMPAQ
jgi:hypothetical protein